MLVLFSGVLKILIYEMIIYAMIINISMIINNYEWIFNNQIAMDIVKLLGFQNELHNAIKEIRKIAKLHQNINDSLISKDITMEYISASKKNILMEYNGIFDFFYELNKIQKNKNTYLPNLYGLLLISDIR